MPRKLTHEEFMERFYVRNKNAGDIEILGEYVNAHTKIKCRCKKDGYEWETRPNDLLNNHGCPKCVGMYKTTEEFVNELKEINNNIEIIGEYKDNKTKIKCKCKIDGHEWKATPNSLLNGSGCPKCVGKIKNKTTEYFINELKEINDDIEILGEYVNNKTKIKCKCKIDGYEWEVIPHSLLSGSGCPKCVGMHKTTEEFKQEMKEINNNIEIIGEYINAKIKIKCKCKIDGHEWEIKPNNLLSGQGCPKCNESKGEKRVAKFLDSKNIEYEQQYKFNNCRSKNELPFDFYIPNLNIAIEYDGEDHYKVNKRSKNDTYEKAFNRFVEGKIRDTIKTIYCKENNIKLIRIAYTEYNNIEKILEKEL